MYFDSCAHPTIDGGWLGSSHGVTFAQFKEELASSDLVGSVAIGLPGIGGYDPIKYFELAVSYDLFPVAPLTSYEDPSIASEIDELSKIGYTAIKIHPRLMGKNNDWSFLKAALSRIHEANMTAFICTYYGASNSAVLPQRDPYWDLTDAFNSTPECQAVLLHGGVVRILEYSLFARHLKNVLLDLSYVMMKYKDSSITADIKFLMSDLDQKLCIGSDSPECTTREISEELIRYSASLETNKFDNIRSNNLMKLLGVAASPKS